MNNYLKTAKRLVLRTGMQLAYHRHLSRAPRMMPDIVPTDWPQSIIDPTGFYLRCFYYYHRKLPAELREHRNYFIQEGRGFGEDAFHTMWYLLFTEFRPARFLEIGVFRGQTISLASLIARHLHIETTISGISPFSSAGDSVSMYDGGVDYRQDTLTNFAHFNLPPPRLLQAYSTGEEAARCFAETTWDMIYIDGNHDYDVARHDWEVCAKVVAPGGVIVLDDAGLTTSYRPPLFATRGHPGPSRLAAEIDRATFREILQVGHNRAFQKVS
jgi:hypothetical protein